MQCSEYKELVAAHADGHLSDEELGRADRHASLCPPCEAARRSQLAVKGLLARRRINQATPESLRAEIARRTVAIATPAARARFSRTRIVLAGAVAAALVLAITPLLRSTDPGLVDTMAADLSQIGRTAPQLATENLAELRSYYSHHGLTFAQSVADLEPFGIRLVGGSVGQLGDTKTTLTVYDSNGTPVVCRRFRAGTVTLPSGGRPFHRSEIFERDGIHVALTKLEDDVICAMASRAPFEQLFASAHASQSFVPVR